MSASPPARRWLGWPLLAVLAVLATGWLLSPAPVPLYDGVGFPDEPYRFVDPPAGYQATPPPGSGQGAAPVSSGVNLQSVYADSGEQGPQAVVALAPGVLRAPSGAKQVTVRVVPVAPDGKALGGFVDGNVYRVTAGAGVPGRVTFPPQRSTSGGSASGLTLRATSARQPGPTMVYRSAAGSSWRRLGTTRVGNDIYRAAFAGLGDYALVFGLPEAGSGSPDGGGAPVLWIVVTAVVLLLLVIGGVRLARARSR